MPGQMPIQYWCLEQWLDSMRDVDVGGPQECKMLREDVDRAEARATEARSAAGPLSAENAHLRRLNDALTGELLSRRLQDRGMSLPLVASSVIESLPGGTSTHGPAWPVEVGHQHRRLACPHWSSGVEASSAG